MGDVRALIGPSQGARRPGRSPRARMHQFGDSIGVEGERSAGAFDQDRVWKADRAARSLRVAARPRTSGRRNEEQDEEDDPAEHLYVYERPAARGPLDRKSTRLNSS